MARKKLRFALRSLAVLCLFLAAMSCTVRLAWFDVGWNHYFNLMIEHGNLDLKWFSPLVTGTPGGKAFNRQFDPGFSPHLRLQFQSVDISFPIAILLPLAAAGLWWLGRAGPPRPGVCPCGYSLAGLTVSTCPECGRRVGTSPGLTDSATPCAGRGG